MSELNNNRANQNAIRAEQAEAEVEGLEIKIGLATHLAQRIITERDFSAPEKAHYIASELLKVLRDTHGK